MQNDSPSSEGHSPRPQIELQVLRRNLSVRYSYEIIHMAAEDVTGAKCELGYEHNGEWCPVRLGSGDWESHDIEDFLANPGFLGQTIEPWDSSIVQETEARCLLHAQEILRGKRPAEYDMWVFPVNGQKWQVERGQKLPPGITHIGQGTEWIEIASLFRPTP